MWRNDTKGKYMFMFPLKNLASKGLRGIGCVPFKEASKVRQALTCQHHQLWNHLQYLQGGEDATLQMN